MIKLNDQFCFSQININTHFSGRRATELIGKGNKYNYGSKEIIVCAFDAKDVFKVIQHDIDSGDTRYLGEIPKDLLEQSGLDELAFFESMNQLALHLKQANYWLETLTKPITRNYKLGNLNLRIKKLQNEGYFNKAYEISGDKTQAYVIKVHKDKEHNPFRKKDLYRLPNDTVYHADTTAGHVGKGLFAKANNLTKEIAIFYAASPLDDWLLMEKIEKTAKTSERSGTPLENPPFRWKMETVGKNNRIGKITDVDKGVIVDYGALVELCIDYLK